MSGTGIRTSEPVLRIGLLGGTFDPVHLAHLQIARAAKDAHGLDQVVFIPNAQSPIKPAAPSASAAQRLEMLRLAIAMDSGFSIETYEMEQGGVSYSVDTVRHIKTLFPGADLFWILGADQLEQLDRWREIESLAEQVEFLVVGRSGSSLHAPKIKGLKYKVIGVPLMDISSSGIREACCAGQIPNEQLPDGLEAFILGEGLYKTLD